jgi:hypothetical protein
VNRVRGIAGLGVAAGLAGALWLVGRPADPPARAADPVAPAAPPVAPAAAADRVVGAAGCSGIACHGNPVAGLVPDSPWGTEDRDLDRWRSSSTVWRCYDPHARAYALLSNELSQDIMKRLKAGQDATTDVRCLACHTNPRVAAVVKSPLHADGVGCEGCHGDAGRWLGPHAGWTPATNRPAAYRAVGMTALFDPAVRAETCAGCHVGSPAGPNTPLRDVTHELIAAGHPRLTFDYATYLRALPPHWAEKDRAAGRLRAPSELANHWLVGRAAGAAAAFDLLAARAASEGWPELAEFDCYACHHNLSAGGWPPRARNGRPGSLRWNDPPLLDALAGLSPVGPRIEPLHDRFRRPADGPGLAAEARVAADQWREVAADWARRPVGRRDLATALAGVRPGRWDDACHLYYAAAALDRSADPGHRQPPDPTLAALRPLLRLPRTTAGARYDSPKGFDPARAGGLFAEAFGRHR